jgi:hypothetical protein
MRPGLKHGPSFSQETFVMYDDSDLHVWFSLGICIGFAGCLLWQGSLLLIEILFKKLRRK